MAESELPNTEAIDAHELPSLSVQPTDLSTTLQAEAVDAVDYQDIQSLGSESVGSEGEDGEGGAEWQAAIEEARSAWTADEAESIVADLKEIGMAKFIHKYIIDEDVSIRKLLFALGVATPLEFEQGEPEAILRVLKAAITRVLRRRDKLDSVNTPDDAVQLICRSRKILVLTGAGVSTSAGLPDFRSADGIYARIESSDGFQLSDPQEMFDIEIFREHPPIFFSFAKELYPSNYQPTPSHRFVKLLEDQGKLLRNYTQNIDTLEHLAGVRKVLHCHGSFATASCIKCGHRVAGETIKDDIFASRVPLCAVCTAPPISSVQGSASDVAAAILQTATPASLPHLPPSAAPDPRPTKRRKLNGDDDDEDDSEPLSEWLGKPVVKPDIVFFGEKLDDSFDRSLLADRDEVDLLLVMGTSLKVAPVADVTGHLPHSIPQILINRDPITHVNFDVQLLGDCDAIVRWLCEKLATVEPHASPPWTVDGTDAADGTIAPDAQPYQRLHDSHIFFFDGANRSHRWLRQFEPTPEEDDAESPAPPDPDGSIAVPAVIPVAGPPPPDAADEPAPIADPAPNGDT